MKLYPNMSYEELQEWASMHGLERALNIPARMLQSRVKEDQAAWLWVYKQSDIPLREVITKPTATERANANFVPLSYQKAAIQLLQEERLKLEQAYAEEDALLKKIPPPMPAISALWDRLLHLRTRIRNVAKPRLRSSTIGHRIWVEENPPTIVYKEETQAWCGDGRWPEIRIDLQSEPAILRCRCSKGAMGKCSIALSAIDYALESLSNPEKVRNHQNLEHLLSTPRWSRALSDLDQILMKEEFPTSLLGWRIKTLKHVGIQLEPVWCHTTSKGEWKQKKADIKTLRTNTDLFSEERELLQLLWPNEGENLKGISSGHKQALIHQAIRKLVLHPRVFLGSKSNQTIEVVESELKLYLFKENGRLIFKVCCGATFLNFAEFHALTKNRIAGQIWILLEDNSCKIFNLSLKKQSIIKSLFSTSLPIEALDEIKLRLSSLNEIVPVILSEPLRGKAFPTSSETIFRVEFLRSNTMKVDVKVRPFKNLYDIGEPPKQIYEYVEGKQVFGIRNLSLENSTLEKKLSTIGLEPTKRTWQIKSNEAILRLLDLLKENQYPVEWVGHTVHEAQPKDLFTKISARQQGFSISGHIRMEDIDSNVDLKDLLISVRDNRPFIALSGAKWLLLNDELRRRLLILADTIHPKQQELFLSQQHIPIVDTILPDTDKPKDWILRANRLKNPLSPPALTDLQTTLRPYQEEAYHWLFNLSQWSPGACLADDMGLGKTVQTLAFLSTQKGPFIVVGPTSLTMNWYYETKKFCSKLDPIIYKGSKRKNFLLFLRENTLLITSYSLLSRDLDVLKAHSFSVLVLDEAQAVKNPQTERAKAAQALPARFKLTLSGTPIENHLLDIWSLFHITNPGLLGSKAQFFKRFIETNRRKALSRLLNPFLLRRLKGQVAKDLPEKIEIEEYIDLSPPERELYNKSHMALLSKINILRPESRFQMLSALTRLRQLACHPRLIDPNFPSQSTKLERAIDLILQMKALNRKVLIFSQFVQLLKLFRPRLIQEEIQFCYLDGSLSIERREEEIQRFQNEDITCFLISLKAGGSGLNLSMASEVILLDPWWNPAVEAQAADRSHRIGQKNNVSIYRLISRNTIESAILKLHQQKNEIAVDLLQDSDKLPSLNEIRNILTNWDNE
ncbi:MAG: DEAD/DEAH box helicase [Myxococcota bacterium]|nr:DEAD/DEAH box helicase [Myxococcota bacterium]